MCNLRSGNLSFPHAPLASQQSYRDVPRENPVKHWHDRVSSLRLQGLGEAASKLSFGMLSSGAIGQWLGVDRDTKPRGTEWTEEPRFEADVEREEVGRGRIGWGEQWRSHSYLTSSNRYANVFGLLLGHVKLSLPPPRSSQIGFSWPKYVPWMQAGKVRE